MGNDDLTHQILIGIRDEIRGTNQRLDATNERLASTNERIDSTNQRIDSTNQRIDSLERVVRENDIRMRTELVGIAGTLDDVSLVLRHNLRLRDRVAAVEADVAELKRRSSE